MSKTLKILVGLLICAAGLAFNLLSFDSFIFFGLPMIAGVAVAWYRSRTEPGRTTTDEATDILRIYMGGHLLWSCLRYWMTDMQPTNAHPLIMALIDMHAFPAIKTLEGVVAIMLLSNRFVPLALVLEIPTAVTIFYLNTFVTARLSGLLTGPPELGVNVILMVLYFQYYRPFLSMRTKTAPPVFLGARKIQVDPPS